MTIGKYVFWKKTTLIQNSNFQNFQNGCYHCLSNCVHLRWPCIAKYFVMTYHQRHRPILPAIWCWGRSISSSLLLWFIQLFREEKKNFLVISIVWSTVYLVIFTLWCQFVIPWGRHHIAMCGLAYRTTSKNTSRAIIYRLFMITTF